MRMLLNLVIIMCLSTLIARADGHSTSEVQTKAATPITTAEQAVERALEATGFGRAQYKQRSNPSEMAIKVVVEDDKTPFFHDRIINKELWVVTFDSVYVKIPRLAA
ncbi:MAG: hypothetical protein ABIE70_10430 [bacterium]